MNPSLYSAHINWAKVFEIVGRIDCFQKMKKLIVKFKLDN